MYIISLFPHLHTPRSPPLPTPFSPSLISLMVSVDVKHHVLFLTSDSLLRYTVSHVVGPVYIPWAHSTGAKLQALVYDIRPPTTAVTDYDIRPPTTAVTDYDIRPPTTAVTDYDIHPPTTAVTDYDIRPPTTAVTDYDIRPPTTAVTDYDIGLEKLSANGQFFVGTQIAVSL